MIKFFRQIRKDLMEKNKTGKYLKYAIGEIVLVVIGILIALQINNWNESRIDRYQEQAILRQLKTEFSNNLNQLDDKINIKLELMNSATNLFNYIDNPTIRNKDSVDYYLGRSMPATTFDPIVNDLASTDRLRLIRSDSLKLLLSLWTSNINDHQLDELTWLEYRNDSYVPFLIEHYQLRTIRSVAVKSGFIRNYLIESKNQDNQQIDKEIGISKHEVNINELLDHPDFEDHLERALTFNRFSHSQSLILKKRILEILSILNTELEKQ